MKKYILIPSLFFLAQCGLLAQQKPSCHGADDFALFSLSEKFGRAHAEPVAFTYSGAGEMISFPAADGKEARAFFIKAEKPTDNYLFVFHEWWGLNDYIKQQAAQFHKDLGNVNVLALDLYDGKTTDKREEAAKLMQALDVTRAEQIILGAVQYAGSAAKITTVGWCLGGGWSLQASLLSGKQAAGCIVYYGMPEQDIAKLKTLNADMLGIYASEDAWITQDMVKEFDKNMKAAGKRFDMVTFDADHAFANPSNPQYDKEKTEKAYQYSIEFLKARLR